MQPSSHRQTCGRFLALFPNISWGGGDFLCVCVCWQHPPSLFTILLSAPPSSPYPQCSFLPSRRSFQKRLLLARIYLFSHCCSTFPSAKNKCFALGARRRREDGEGKRKKKRREPTAGWELLLWSGSDRRSEMTQAWTADVCISPCYTSAPICLHSLSFVRLRAA